MQEWSSCGGGPFAISKRRYVLSIFCCFVFIYIQYFSQFRPSFFPYSWGAHAALVRSLLLGLPFLYFRFINIFTQSKNDKIIQWEMSVYWRVWGKSILVWQPPKFLFFLFLHGTNYNNSNLTNIDVVPANKRRSNCAVTVGYVSVWILRLGSSNRGKFSCNSQSEQYR